jgi:hypothetical protein
VLTKTSAADFATGWAAAAGGGFPVRGVIGIYDIPPTRSRVGSIEVVPAAVALTGLNLVRFYQFASGEFWEAPLWLAAGTYTITAIMVRNNSYGVVTFSIDGVDLATTFDGYAAAVAVTTLTITTVPIVGDGQHLFRARVASKNASSANFFHSHCGFAFDRTGA